MNRSGKTRNHAPTIAVIAALDVELAPFRNSPGDGCLLLETGMGVVNARCSLRSFLRHQRVQAVISVGLAGALSPHLEVGDLVIVRKFLNPVDAQPSPKLTSLAEKIEVGYTKLYSGSVVTVNDIIHKAVQRRNLAEEFRVDGTAILDMESSAIAETCTEFQTPFIIIRSISDRFDEDLPIDFNRCIGNDGNLRLSKILLAILLNPLAIPGLFTLRKRCQSCTSNLVSFIDQFLPRATV